jgi:hypothetical protein
VSALALARAAPHAGADDAGADDAGEDDAGEDDAGEDELQAEVALACARDTARDATPAPRGG